MLTLPWGASGGNLPQTRKYARTIQRRRINWPSSRLIGKPLSARSALSLNVILDELMMTLEEVYTENSEADFDDALCVAGREM